MEQAVTSGASSASNIAVLMTCHNRCEATLACLRSLFGQRTANLGLSVFLVDDGSSDGTAETVAKEFSKVNVIQGNGHLYWSGGMRLAFDVATREDADFHLWLNDDVVLDRDAIGLLLSTYEETQRRRPGPTIVVGAVMDPISGTTTYSGLRRRSAWHPLRFEFVDPGPVPKLCDTMSGNVVLISRDAFEKLGAIDPAFVHTMGDCDYGLRLARIGGGVWLAAQHVGTCSRGDRLPHPADCSVIDRLRDIGSSKKLPPLPWLTYVRRHGGLLWPILWIGPYAKVVGRSVEELIASRVKRMSYR
jgi:GT2 family glycosyltransferase